MSGKDGSPLFFDIVTKILEEYNKNLELQIKVCVYLSTKLLAQEI